MKSQTDIDTILWNIYVTNTAGHHGPKCMPIHKMNGCTYGHSDTERGSNRDILCTYYYEAKKKLNDTVALKLFS